MWSNLIGGQHSAQDGWDEDEDLEMDDSDHSNPHQPPQPQVNGGGDVRKMFVGRLTRFLEQVTHPDEDNDHEEEDDDDQDGWQEDDEVLFEDDNENNIPTAAEDKKVEDYAPAAVTKAPEQHPNKDESENAWNDDLGIDDVGLEDDAEEFPTMRESITQAEAALDQALEDIHRQEAAYGSDSDNDLHEDDAEERKAILEIQREMKAVSDPPVVDVTPASGQRSRWTRSAATSIATQWATEDGTRDSGPTGKSDDEDIFQDENEDEFGPVVDQVPRKPIPLTRTDSLAVQANQEEEEEDVLDETIVTTDEDLHHATIELSNGCDDRSAVVDHTPSVAHSRKSHGESVDAVLSIAGETTLVNGEEEDSPADYGPVVDQIPENATRAAPKSGSVFPVVADDDLSQEFKMDEAMDDTIVGKGDASTLDENTVDQNGWVDDDVDINDVDVGDKSTEDDDGVDVNQSADTTKISSILQESTNSAEQQQNNMVDYTPYEEDGVAPGAADPSVVVLAADEDLTRDTGEPTDDEVFGEENELDFAPVVDHTPADSSNNNITSAVSLQVEASALEEDFRQDDAMDETCFGDSTVDPKDVDDVPDGWEDEDLKTPALPNPNLVDQTPSEWGSPPPKNADPSVAVLASIDESADEEVSEYGLVVDQTPRTPALPAASRSDSIIVQAADMETVEDESLNDDDDDGDTFTDELPLGVGAVRSAEDILVDRVPPRPESRFGDASTMVAADPSEILSEADDLMAPEEEQNFGPVVDVTPPSQAVSGRPSAAGSTAAFAPNSVATDDLEEDDGDETEGNDAWNSTILEEATPNPQSGNDEPLQQQEQLVDFLPEEDASSHPPEDVSVMGRTASSSVAIGGAQSLLQPEDPKEDDFGPVVDQTPTPLSNVAVSAASTATHVTASELRSLEKEDNIEGRSVDFDLEEEKESKVVVDYVPNIREKQILDSVATVAQSQLTEEEEEEETASKFGPVVDHLPTPRTSLAPSRGGSTVDALAAVSEADSAGNEGNGWEDDLDLEDASAESDRTDRISTRGSVRRAQSTASDHDRSVSVRFDSTVRTASLKPPPIPPPPTKDLHAASQNSSTTDGWEDDDIATDAADASSIGTGEASRLFDHSIANAETPPSTPYNRPVLAGNIADMSLLQPSMKECPSCANAKSMECPCVQKLLRVTRGAGSLTGTLYTAEGDALEVDFGEMLREEMAKRRLLEEEAEALRTLSSSQQQASDRLAANETSLQSDITNLRQENDKLMRRIGDLKSERDRLQDSSRNLSSDLKRSQNLADELHKAKLELAQRESARLAEINGLKKLLDEKSEKLSAEEDIRKSLVSVEKKLLEKDAECQQLGGKVANLCMSLKKAEAEARRASSELECQVSKYEEKLSLAGEELSKSQSALVERSSALEQAQRDAAMHALASKDEIDNLRAAKEMADRHVAELHSQHQSEMERQYNLLDSRMKELKAIEAKLKLSEDTKKILAAELQKQRSINDGAANLSNSLASVTKERDELRQSLAATNETVNSLQSLVDEQGMQRETLDSKREYELGKLRTDVKTMEDKLRSKEKQIEELNARLRKADMEKDGALADTEAAQSAVWDMQEQLDTSNALLADAESKVDGLEANVRDAEARAQHAQRTFEAADSEKKHLESRLMGLEKKLEMVTADANRQAMRANDLDRKLHGAQEELHRVRAEKDAIASQQRALDNRIQSVQSQMSMQLQEQHRQADQAIREREEELQQLRQELHTLSQQSSGQKSLELELNNAREWVDLLQKEKGSLAEENEELLVQLGSWKIQTDETKATVESLRLEMDALLLAVDAVNNGDDYNPNASEMSEAARSVVEALFGLQTRYAELEAEMTSYSSDRESGLEKRIQDLEEKCRSKDSEISMLREIGSAANAAKDDSLNDLQQHVHSLENAIREKDHVIQAKSFELTEAKSRLTSLQGQLDFARTSQDDASSVAHQMRMATTRAERAEKALQHSQTELDQTKDLVRELEAQLSSHEANLREMQEAQASSRRLASADMQGWQQHAHSLEEEVARKSVRIAELEKQVEALERSRQTAPSQSVSAAEMDTLRNQVASLTSTLQSTRDQLTARDSEAETTAAHVRALEEKQEQSATRLDDVNGDDVESLRSQIVLLATALEESETKRADTIERLMQERRENGESLRRLGESVQRFYSDVRNIS